MMNTIMFLILSDDYFRSKLLSNRQKFAKIFPDESLNTIYKKYNQAIKHLVIFFVKNSVKIVKFSKKTKKLQHKYPNHDCNSGKTPFSLSGGSMSE